MTAPRPSAPKVRETGPGPLRTALGAGRLLLLREELVRLAPGRVRLEVLRDREVELLALVFGLELDADFEAFDFDEDVLLLRDPGGEDVRVAMVRRLGHRHSSHTDHTMRVAVKKREPSLRGAKTRSRRH